MTADQKRDIHQIVQKLIGPEILEETVNKVLIQDLIDPEELQSERALRRIKTVVRSMIQDALGAMVTNDREMAADVIQRDDDVDRLYLLVSRQFTEILRSGSVREESLDPITAFNYTRAATNLERMPTTPPDSRYDPPMRLHPTLRDRRRYERVSPSSEPHRGFPYRPSSSTTREG
jgi:phosphate uptake regulator